MVVEVGTKDRVLRRRERMKRTIEGRDAYEHGGVAPGLADRGWAGGSGAADGTAGSTPLHRPPGISGGDPAAGDRRNTEGNNE
jgi:hypothetical protein